MKVPQRSRSPGPQQLSLCKRETIDVYDDLFVLV